MVSKQASGILRLVRSDILAMIGYEPIEPSELLAERLGIPEGQVAKLDGNENPYGPPPRVLEVLGSLDTYNRYPDPQQRTLRAALSEYAGVPPEHIVAGHGSDEIIDLLLRALLAPGDAVIDCPPTFGMYGFSTRVAGGRVIEVPRNEDYSLDLGAVRAAAPGAKAISIASPNNPTGNVLSPGELDELLDTGMLVVVDEAYIEFASEESYARLVPERENLVVLRTFSKWAGLAGLRAGYGILPQPLADVLMQIKPPYTPNVAAEAAMLAALDHAGEQLKTVRVLVEERERLAAALRQLEFVHVYPSEANFLLCRVATADESGGSRVPVSGSAVRDRLAQRGLFVRYFNTALLQDCIRISAGLPEHTDRIVDALKEIGGSRGG
jgi:histidinol-phosphate aminotransferase